MTARDPRSPEHGGSDADYYERLEARWPEERPSRKRRRRARRQRGQVVVTRAEKLAKPDAERMSRALLAAQRELTRAQADAEARAHAAAERQAGEGGQ